MSKRHLYYPLDSLECTMAFATKDWSEDKNDAWLWGIICGWDEESLEELQDKFGWSTESVERLSMLHDKFNTLKEEV